MNSFILHVRALARDESGITSIEYAVLASMIAIAVVVTVYLLGQRLHDLYAKVQACIAAPSAANCS